MNRAQHPVYEGERYFRAANKYHHAVTLSNLIRTNLFPTFNDTQVMNNFCGVLRKAFMTISRWLERYQECQSCNEPIYLHSASIAAGLSYPRIVRYDPTPDLPEEQRYVIDEHDPDHNGSLFPPIEQVRYKLNRLESLVHSFKGSLSRLNWERINTHNDRTYRSRRLLALIATAESELDNLRHYTYELYAVMTFLSIEGAENLKPWMEDPNPDHVDPDGLLQDYENLSDQILEALQIIESAQDMQFNRLEGVPDQLRRVRTLLQGRNVSTTRALRAARPQLIQIVYMLANHVDLYDASINADNEPGRFALGQAYLGKGDFGEYFECIMDAEPKTAESVIGRRFLDASARRELQIELLRWRLDGYNRFLQQLSGTVIWEGRLYIITSPVGDVLRDRIHGNNSIDPQIHPDLPTPENRLKHLKRALSVANALEFLETRGIVHYNLTSSAVLIESDEHVVLSRVGFYLTKEQLRTKKGEGRIINEYQAPQVLASRRWSHAAVTFSFGILLWEIVHRAVPHQTLDPTEIIHRVYHQGHTLPAEETLPPTHVGHSRTLERLMKECTAYSAYDRPPIGTVVNALHSIIHEEARRSLSTNNWINRQSPPPPPGDTPITTEPDYADLPPANLLFREKNVETIFRIMSRTIGYPEYQVEALRELKTKTDVARESDFVEIATYNFAGVLRESIESNKNSPEYMKELFAVLRNLARFKETNKAMYQRGIPQLLIRTILSADLPYINDAEAQIAAIKALWEMITNTTNSVKRLLIPSGIVEHVCNLCSDPEYYEASNRRISKLYGFLCTMLSLPEAQDIIFDTLEEDKLREILRDPNITKPVKVWGEKLGKFFDDHRIDRNEDEDFFRTDGRVRGVAERNEYSNLEDMQP